jgi:Sodium:dicarboxylate symporter family
MSKQENTAAHQEAEAEGQGPKGCGILGRYPVLSVLAFAAVGIGLGLGLSFWDPEDSEDKKVALKWIGLIGDMFIRALKAIVLPLVFVNVTLSVIDMMSVGRASSVGWKTIGLYLLTTLLASILGLISIVSFKGMFEQGEFEGPGKSRVQLGCEDGGYLAHDDSGDVFCSANITDDMNSYFVISDVDSTFEKKSSGPKNERHHLRWSFFQAHHQQHFRLLCGSQLRSRGSLRHRLRCSSRPRHVQEEHYRSSVSLCPIPQGN